MWAITILFAALCAWLIHRYLYNSRKWRLARECRAKHTDLKKRAEEFLAKEVSMGSFGEFHALSREMVEAQRSCIQAVETLRAEHPSAVFSLRAILKVGEEYDALFRGFQDAADRKLGIYSKVPSS